MVVLGHPSFTRIAVVILWGTVTSVIWAQGLPIRAPINLEERFDWRSSEPGWRSTAAASRTEGAIGDFGGVVEKP